MTRSIPTPHKHAQLRGFSLVELLVAMVIGLILVSGMVAVFAGNKRSSDMNAAMANIQEGARFAINTINTAATGSLITDTGDWVPASSVGFTPPDSNKAVPGTHALLMQFGHAAQQVGLSGEMTLAGVPSLAGPVMLTEPMDDVEKGDFVIVANCETGDLFQVTEVLAGGTQLEHRAGANRTGNLQQVYGNARTLAQTTAMKFQSNIYYIGETGLTNEDGSEVTALYQQGLPYNDQNPPTELIQGVENMRVSFGLRDDKGRLRYVTPEDPNFNPRDVESVQIGLLMSS